MFFTKKAAEKKMENMHHAIAASFQHVKRDNENIMKWLHYFNQKIAGQEQHISHLNMTIGHLRNELSAMPKTKEQLRLILDEYYAHRPVNEKIDALNDKTQLLERMISELKVMQKQPIVHTQHIHQMDNEHIQKLNSLQDKLDTLEKAKKATLKEKIVQKITRKSKDYMKSMLLSYIRKYEKITALQLKDMIVEEQGLMSKSSFYRLLEEIEEEPEIAVVKEGKEKHYLFKVLKHA